MVTDSTMVVGALAGIKSGMDTIRSVLALVKDTTDTLPDGTRKTAITESLETAEREIRLSEVQIASALGYRLCRCTFPPQIMLGVGQNSRGHERRQCPGCKRLETIEPQFGSAERIIRYNAGI